jgi:hypothetical protein
VSNDYLRSVVGQQDWQAAVRSDPQGFARKLIPVRVEACEPLGLLGGIAALDLFDKPPEEARDYLVSRVGAAILGRGKPTIPPNFPIPVRERSPRTVPGFPSDGEGRSRPQLEAALDAWVRSGRAVGEDVPISTPDLLTKIFTFPQGQARQIVDRAEPGLSAWITSQLEAYAGSPAGASAPGQPLFNRPDVVRAQDMAREIQASHVSDVMLLAGFLGTESYTREHLSKALGDHRFERVREAVRLEMLRMRGLSLGYPGTPGPVFSDYATARPANGVLLSLGNRLVRRFRGPR